MGAFGSCLGVGRPISPGANPRLLGSNLVNVDTNPFGLPNGPKGARGQFSRNQASLGAHQQTSTRQAYLTNNGGPNAGPGKGLPPMPKLPRQSSSLSGNPQQQVPPFSPSQNVPKLVDIDDSSFDKVVTSSQNNNNILNNSNNNNNSHLVCNKNNINKPNGFTNNNSNNTNNNNNNNNSSGIGNEKLPASVIFMQSIQLNPSEVRDLLALYDYEPRTNDDLGFIKGEHLETTLSLMNDQWWLARSKSTKKIGWVPSNYVAQLKTLGAEPWYLGKIGRLEAETRLKKAENKDGAFIIRDSDTTMNQYSLSLKHENDVKHYRIRQFETGGFYINKKQVFSTIHTLVEHYSQAPDGLCINLRDPCVSGRLDKPTTAGLSYDTCDDWEINRNLLTIGKELGRGQFGQVFEGVFHSDHGKKVPVAIKTLRKGSMDPEDFLAEAQIMKKMRHENLVQLYAVCTREEPVYIITELMSKGALINYLQTEIGRKLPLIELINMATQIANGMSYLEREKYVHRDLAARNILVGENNICKIADFGLARLIKENEYEAKVGARFPIKWSAIESFLYSKFTTKSDIWSFGIVLYEIITSGQTPYPNLTNAEVLAKVEKGYRMPCPPNCPPKLYQIMLECWNKDPEKRPTFETLHWRLTDYFSSDEQYRDAIQFRDT